jgi:DNA-binding NtrC family response regulator
MILDTIRSEVSLAPSGVSHSQPVCMIVEDQPLIGFALEAYLEEAGFGTCEVFRSAAETLAWLATHTPTVAVLDFSLQDGPCTTLTGVLVERGIPFVIYSGHKRSIAPCELQHVPWISKPCDREVLLAALTRAAPALSTWSTGIQPQERTILLQRG